MRAKKAVMARLKTLGVRFANFVSDKAMTHPDLILGENNVIMPNTHIEPGVIIGDNNVIWSNSLICHDVYLGSHNHVSAGTVVAGLSRVNNLCFFGIGSAVINGVEIADETHVLPGTFIYENTIEFSKYFGNPAIAIGNHSETGICIERG
jgi:UDP-N-acetylbacillosamine N-acetyltransferase